MSSWVAIRRNQDTAVRGQDDAHFGADRAIVSVDNYVLNAGAVVETLGVSGTATILSGNEQNNTLLGGNLADTLNVNVDADRSSGSVR